MTLSGQVSPPTHGSVSTFPSLRTRTAALLLLVLAVLPYVNAGNTVLFFDTLILHERPMAKDLGLAIKSLVYSHVIPGAELAMVTFAANYRLNTLLGREGFDPAGFVVVNILIHALNSVLIYFLLLRFGRHAGAAHLADGGAALLAAALFAVHPLHASSILYVVQRRGMLCVTFGLLSLLAWLRARKSEGGRYRFGWFLTAVVCGLLGLKCKSTGLTLPLIILAMEYCLCAGDRASMAALRRWAIPAVAGSFLCMAGYLVWRGLLDLNTFEIAHVRTVESLSWGVREQALSQAPAALHYWKLLLLPLPHWLSIDHDIRPTLDLADPTAWLCVALNLVILSAGVWSVYRGRRATALGIFIFHLSLIPWMATPQPIIFAEYKAYPLAVGLALVVMDKLGAVLATSRRSAGESNSNGSVSDWGMQKTCVIGGCVLLILTLMSVAWMRNPVYSSSTRLWQDVVVKAPNLFRGRYNLANALSRERRFEEAVSQYREAIRLDDDNFRPHFNLANTLRHLGREQEAVSEYIETVRLNPEHAGAKSALRQLGLEVEAVP